MALNKFSNIELLDCPNCHGLSEHGKCMWLTLSYCKGVDCTFMKIKETYVSSLKKAQERLSTLDEKKQARIAQKYYDGKRPWKQE